MARGLEKPPRWATVLMIVGAVFLAVALPLTAHRGDVSPAQVRAAESYSRAHPASTLPQRLPVLVFGDSYTAGSNNKIEWPQILAGARRWNVANEAVGGSGYVSGQQTFGVQAAAMSKAKPGLVLFVGSRNDQYEPQQVQAAALAAYQTIQKDHPGVPIVVIGPIWDNTPPTAGVRAADQAVRAAGQAAGVTFIDALPRNWLGDPALIQVGNVHPNDQGQQALATAIGQALDQLPITTSGAAASG